MDNLKKSLSILICTNNRPEKLKECLLSIKLQHLWVDEIIIIDSSQKPIGYSNLINICQSIKLKYFTTKIKSIPYSRNLLLKKAKNNLCMFVDDDVFLNKNAILNCLLFFKKNPKSAIVGGIGYPKNENNIYSLFNFKIIFYHALKTKKNIVDVPFCPTMICGFQKKIIQKYKLRFDPKMFSLEDIDLCLALKKNGEAIFIDKKISGTHYYRTDLKSFYISFYNYYLNAKKVYLKHQIDILGVQRLLGKGFYFKALKYLFNRNDEFLRNFSKNKIKNIWLCFWQRLAMINAVRYLNTNKQ